MGKCTDLNTRLNQISVCNGNVSFTSICLVLLICLNIYVQRHTAAKMIAAVWFVYKMFKLYSAESKALKTTAPNPILRVNGKNQHLLTEELRKTSPMVPTSTKKVMIESLDAVVNTPTLPTTNSKTCFVLTHPWGILGGDMDNNVPSEIANALTTFGYNTVRFNFRGVGRSSGCCTWRGHGERNDLKTILTWILSNKGIPNIEHIVLVGYSYGSMISNSAADLFPQIKAFVSIATPFTCYWGLSLFNCAYFNRSARTTTKPKLFMCGDADDFTGTKNYKKYTKCFDANKIVYLIDGVDHGWWGVESVAVALILRFIQEKLPEIGGGK